MEYTILNEAEKCFDDLENIKTIELGTGQNFYVLNNGKPYICLKVEAFNAFTDAVIFNDYLYIGNYYNGLYIVNLKDFTVRNIEINGYFGYFHLLNDVLYVLGCCYIIKFDSFSNIIWKSEHIAVDGILFNEIRDNVIYIDCEMDPPGGWIKRTIDAITGKEIR